MEIKDSKVLARVNNLVPGICQAGTAAGNGLQIVLVKLLKIAKLLRTADRERIVHGGIVFCYSDVNVILVRMQGFGRFYLVKRLDRSAVYAGLLRNPAIE